MTTPDCVMALYWLWLNQIYGTRPLRRRGKVGSVGGLYCLQGQASASASVLLKSCCASAIVLKQRPQARLLTIAPPQAKFHYERGGGCTAMCIRGRLNLSSTIGDATFASRALHRRASDTRPSRSRCVSVPPDPTPPSEAVSDLDDGTRFYEAVLGVIGYRKLEIRGRTVGFGKEYLEFWINLLFSG